MKKRILKTVAIIILSAVMIANAIPYISISAEPDGNEINVFKNVSSSVELSVASQLIDDFSSGDVSAYSSSRGSEISVQSGIPVSPYTAFSSSQCLELRINDPVSEKWSSLVLKPESIHLGKNASLIYSINCQNVSAKVYTKLVVYNGNNWYESSPVEINSGVWNSVVCELEKMGKFSTIDKIEICVMVKGKIFDIEEMSYYLDSIMLSNSENIKNSICFMSDNFRSYGGSIVYNENDMCVSLSGTDPYIESYNSESVNIGKANSIRIKLSNSSGCKSIKLYYTSEDSPIFSEEYCSTAQISTSGAVQTCYFPVSVNEILQMRLVFEGSISGDIRIYSISPASSYIEKDSIGIVYDCSITRDKTLKVNGSVNSNYLNEHRSSQICLFALPMYSSIGDINEFGTLLAMAPISDTFSFEISDLPPNQLLCETYAVCVKNGGIITPICSEQYVNNPEMLSDTTWESEINAGKKGLVSALISDDLGITHTSVNIYLDELISLDVSEYSFRYDEGITYYYDSNTVKHLDSVLKEYYDNNVIVTACLQIRKSGDTRKDSMLIYNNGAEIGQCCAWNVADVDGLRYITAALNFISRRYSSDSTNYGRIENYTVGNGINDAWSNFYAGDMLLCDYIELYEKIFRLGYNIIKSNASQCSVYISLGNGWDIGLLSESTRIYDNCAILDNFNSCVNEKGNIAWNLAYDPYPYDDSYLAYSDNRSSNDYETDTITIKNIEILYNYTSRSIFNYNGDYRSIILLEMKEGNSFEDEYISADYIYSLFKISSKNYDRIKALIVDKNLSYADTLKYADTSCIDEKCSFALQILGVNDFSELIAGYVTDKVAKYCVIEKGFDFIHPYGTAGNISILKLSKDNLMGWNEGIGCDSLIFENQYMGYDSLLRFTLSGSEPRLGRGIVCRPDNVLNLSYTPYLQTYVQLVSMPEDVETAKITWRLYSGRNYIEASSAVKKGEWINLIFPISDFPYISSIDQMTFYVSGVDGTDIGEPTVFISEIVGISDKYTGEELERLFAEMNKSEEQENKKEIDMRIVWILVIIIIICLTVWIATIMTRLRHSGDKD